MSDREERLFQEEPANAARREPYIMPEVKWLGTLDELTAGGDVEVDDGHGFAGSSGTI